MSKRKRRRTTRFSRLVPFKPASREIGVPYTSMRDVVFRGELAVIKIGRAWYLDRREVEQWIERQKERAR